MNTNVINLDAEFDSMFDARYPDSGIVRTQYDAICALIAQIEDREMSESYALYAKTRFMAVRCRLDGRIAEALKWEAIADSDYDAMPAEWQW